MEIDYTLVTSPHEKTDPNELIKAFGPQGQDQFSVVQIRPTIREVADLRNDAKTIALTPTMPMTLIEPKAGDEKTQIQDSGSSWGIEAIEAHSSRFDGQGAVVAVLDTGIVEHHPAFSSVQVISENFTDDASSVDGNGHGTHCAGTIAGNQVNNRRIGVAPGVQKLLCGKVLTDAGQGSTTAIVKGVQWASMQGAHVISMSLGIDFPAYVDSLHKVQGVELKAAVSLALQAYSSNVEMFAKLGDSLSALSYIGQGSLLIAASGNESRRPAYTIGTSPPAVASSIVSVAAVNRQLAVADFSNTNADISAPGVNIESAGIDGSISVLSGTSMAAPHVAGVAALWTQRFLETDQPPSVEQLKSAIYSNVRVPEHPDSSDFLNLGRGIVLAPNH